MDSGSRTVVVTGARGFIGRNLLEALNRRPQLDVLVVDKESPPSSLARALRRADVVFHLAGVNRPERVEEYEEDNHLLTRKLAAILEEDGRTALVVFSSSVQAGQDNPYGKSKLRAEEALRGWSERTGAPVGIFRLKSVFGKWCRPAYNSVVATFCYNVARGLPITISDSARKTDLVYIDDVVSAFMDCLDRPPQGVEYRDVLPSFSVALSDLARQVEAFRDSRSSGILPDLGDPFTSRLFATYSSYLVESELSYPLRISSDTRGDLAELLKQAHFGQVFVSRTRPGVTRGNHVHDRTVEKYIVIEGEAAVRLRRIDRDEITEYRLSGRDLKVVDIPPGYTHSLENIGKTELITLFWASEVFDPDVPDSHACDVFRGEKKETGS